MDAEVKQRNRRRKRAQRMQAQRDVMSKNQVAADSNEDEDGSPIREKPPRPPIRRKKSKEPLVEEDIIDGFAVLGFKTYEDLEAVLKLANKENVRRLAEVQDRVVPPRVPQLPQLPGTGELHRPAHHLTHHISAHAQHSLTTLSHDAATSDDSGRASERLTGSSVAPRDADSSRDRLSDASSRCSSGKGYICDSEGDDDKGSDASSVIFGLGGLSSSTTTACATVTTLSRNNSKQQLSDFPSGGGANQQHLVGSGSGATATATAASSLGPNLPSLPCNVLSNGSGVGSPVPAPTPPPAAPAPSPAPAQLPQQQQTGGDKVVVGEKVVAGATSLTTRLLGPTGMGVPTPSAAVAVAGSDMDTTPTGAAAGGAATATSRGLDMTPAGVPPSVTPNSLPSPAPAASVPASTPSLPSSTPTAANGVAVGGAIPPNVPSVRNQMLLASTAATPVTSHPHPPTALDSAATPSNTHGGITTHHVRTDSPAVAAIATSAPSYHPSSYHHQQHHQQLQSTTPQLYTPYAPHVTTTSASTGYVGMHPGHHMQQHHLHHSHHSVGMVSGPGQQQAQQHQQHQLVAAPTGVGSIPRSPGSVRCLSPGSAVRERDSYGALSNIPPRNTQPPQLPPPTQAINSSAPIPPHPTSLSSTATTVSSSPHTNSNTSSVSNIKQLQPPPPSPWSGLQPSIIPPIAPPQPSALVGAAGPSLNGVSGSVQSIMGPPPRHHSPANMTPGSAGAVVSTIPNPYSIPSMFPAAVTPMSTTSTPTTSGSPSIVTAHAPIPGSGGVTISASASPASLPPPVPPIPANLQPPTIPPVSNQQQPPPQPAAQATQQLVAPPPPLPFSAESLFQSSVNVPSSASQTQADLLRRELDNRFLASTQDRGAAPPPPPYLRTEMHQHQHHHTHVHQHTTSLMPPGAAASANMFPSPLFKDIPKMGSVESPFYRQSSLALPGSYGAYGAGLLHPGLTAPAGPTPFVAPTHLPAFQPKVRVFNPPVAQESPAKPKLTKSGKWNAMHVRVAWEIYHHQHKGDKPGSGLKADLLRPPTHLFNPSVRAHELGPPPPGSQYPPPPPPGSLAAASVAAAAAGHRPPGAVGIPPPGAYDAHHGSLFTSPAGLAAAVAAQHHHHQQQLAAGRTTLSPFTRYSSYPAPPGPPGPPPPISATAQSPYSPYGPAPLGVIPGGGPGPPPPGPHRADLAAALLHDPWRRTYAPLPPPPPPTAPWGLKSNGGPVGSASEALLNLEQQQKAVREREQREQREREERERVREERERQRREREERERREREEKQRRLEQQQQEQRERDRREKERREHERRELERERERVERERQLHQQRMAAQQAAAAAAAAAAQAAAIDQKPSLSSLGGAGAGMRDRSPTISMRNGGLVYKLPDPFHSPSFLPGPDELRIKEEPRISNQQQQSSLSLPPTSTSINHQSGIPKQEEESSASLHMRNAAAAAAAAMDPRYHPYLRTGPPPPHMSLQPPPPPHLSRVMAPPHHYGAPPGAPVVAGHHWSVAPPDPYFSRYDHLRSYNPLMDAAILRAEEERAKLYSAAYGPPLHHPSSIAHAHAQAAAHAHAHAAQLRAKDSAAAAALMHMRGPPGPPTNISSGVGGPLPPPTSSSNNMMVGAGSHKVVGTPPNIGIQGQLGVVGGPMEMKKEEPR